MHKLERHQILGGDGKTMVWVYDGDVEYISSPNILNKTYYINENGDKRKTRNLSQYMAMKARGNTASNFQKRQPTYDGVKFSEEFSTFDKWVNLMENRVGYMCVDNNNRLWQLDKDLLGNGKLYSSENVCFLPQSVNTKLSSFHKYTFQGKKEFFEHVYNNYFDTFEDEVLEAFFEMSKFDFGLDKEPRLTLEEKKLIDDEMATRHKISLEVGRVYAWDDNENPMSNVSFKDEKYTVTCANNGKKICNEKFTSVYDAVFKKIEVKLLIIKEIEDKWRGNYVWDSSGHVSVLKKKSEDLLQLKRKLEDGSVVLKQWVEVEIPYKSY